MIIDFGCNIGDSLYVALIDTNKYETSNRVCEFVIDCFKVFGDDFTAHGLIYGAYGKFGVPTEFSLKKLNKRIIFTNKKDAIIWMNKQIQKASIV